MKDFIISLILTAVLILVFGAFPIGAVLPSCGVSPQYPGDSGMILPGGGTDMAEFTVEKSEKSAPEPKTESGTAYGESGQHTIDEIEEEQYKMDNAMLLAFWHGVAAVLIGEASALMVVGVWVKIKRRDAIEAWNRGCRDGE